MTATKYTHSAPWISFIYDLQKDYEFKLQKTLEICKQDWRDENAQDESIEKEQKEEEEKILTSKNLNFEENIEKVDLDEYFYDALKTNTNDSYTYLRLRSPEGMDQNIASLDYSAMMNKVLQNLKRTRSKVEAQTLTTSMQDVGVHLPPVNIYEHITPNTEMDYNTEERIKSIKKFVQLNRKKASKADNRQKRKILQDELDKFVSYEDLRDKLEEKMDKHFHDA